MCRGDGVVLPQQLSGGIGSHRTPGDITHIEICPRGRGGFSKTIVLGEGWSEKVCLPTPLRTIFGIALTRFDFFLKF